MEILSGQNLSKMVDYSFGDHQLIWNKNVSGHLGYANANNEEFLAKAKEFRGKIMTLFIDNIRLYPREVKTDTDNDRLFITEMMITNNLLALCATLPANAFVIFTGEEDTPINEKISLPFNVVRLYAVNALYNNDRIIPFPIGLQRQIGENDRRLIIMEAEINQDLGKYDQPKKLLYINCGIERNLERAPLAKFETNEWVTTRFDKDSMFFSYDRYHEFLSELRDHKFVVCPKGHGMDTHRIWETLYMRRVPVMIDHPYFRRLLKEFPVVYIDAWEDIDELSLKQFDYWYKEAQTMDMSKLDLTKIYEGIRQECNGLLK